ncbi:MAG TPA: DinB family protein [Gemmatimonadales bacterium]
MTRTDIVHDRAEALAAELDQEARTTRRVLERVPESKLSWRPHPKSWSLGQLALHVANVPGGIARALSNDSFEPTGGQQEEATSSSQLLTAHDTGIAAAREFVSELSPERADAVWRLMRGGREIMARPRIEMIRGLMLNHWYHHRGQLSVYLRLLDVPVPSVYGPTADENPFSG